MTIDTEAAHSWFSPDWCDWRWRIRGCKDETLWKDVYIVHTLWGSLVTILGIWVIFKKIYIKLWRKKLRLFDRVEGGIKPRAGEVFALLATVHMFGRALYTAVILGKGFNNFAVTEFFHEWPWSILYSGGVFMNVGLIYATPRFKMNLAGSMSKLTAVERVRLPSPGALNVIMVIYTVIPCVTLSLFAILDGAARDRNDWSKASFFNSVHYGLWSAYCWALATLSSYFGVKLVLLLRASQAPHAGGGSSSGGSTGGRGEFRRAVMTLIITLSCTIVIEVSFANVLLFYAIFRDEIQSIRGISIWIGFVWIFITPLMLSPILGVMAYSLIKTKQEKTSRNASAAATSGTEKASQVNNGTSVNTAIATNGPALAALPAMPTTGGSLDLIP